VTTMPKNANANNSDNRFVPRAARAIVRLWPTESREWGQAFAAELPAAQTAGATTTWLIGGLMLLLREWLKHAWRALFRPIGATANSSDPTVTFTARYSREPRSPLWLMLALTLSSLAILLHPEVRQSLRRLRSEYFDTGWNPDQWSSVKHLRHLSNSKRDPQLLAILSLLSDNDDERLALSDEAIKKDPSLTWLDFEQSLLPKNDLSKEKYFSQERLNRLMKWDPDNAIPHLLAAEMIAKPTRVEAFDSLMRGKSKTGWEKALIDNPQLAAEMHAAFTAPKYEAYASQAVELVRSVSAPFSVQDPEIALYILVNHRFVQFDLLRGYAGALMDRAAQFESAGRTSEAAACYTEILQFAQRMSLNGSTPGEQFIAQRLGSDAGEKLIPLYQSTNRREEASLIQFQLQKWSAEHDPKILRYVPVHYRQSQWNSIAWSGSIITFAAFVLAIVFPLALIALFFVIKRRRLPLEQRTAIDFWSSLCADSAPWVLLASAVLLFITYHPYAKACSAFLKGGNASPSVESFMTASLVPNAIPDAIDFLYNPYFQWVTITTTLSILLAFFLWRMLLRPKPAT
jgi:hypothetical protein